MESSNQDIAKSIIEKNAVLVIMSKTSAPINKDILSVLNKDYQKLDIPQDTYHAYLLNKKIQQKNLSDNNSP